MFFFAMWSRVRTESSGILGRNEGKSVPSLRPNRSSAGDVPVMECGVERYWRKNVYNSCFQFRPSMCHARIVFSSVRMNLSHSALACGHSGVIFR